MQRELSARRAEGTEVADGGPASPRSPRSPRPSTATTTATPALAMRSHSESDAAAPEEEEDEEYEEEEEEVQGARGRGSARLKAQTESLFLDALSLDPLSGLEAPPPSRLDSEKRFPCMKEVMQPLHDMFLYSVLCTRRSVMVKAAVCDDLLCTSCVLAELCFGRVS